MGCNRGDAMRYFRAAGSRGAVTLALLALCTRLLIPLGQLFPIGEDENGFPIRLVICTLYGVEVLDTKPGEKAPDEQTDRKSCPVCLAFSVGVTLPENDAAASIDALHANIASFSSAAEVHITSQFLPGSRTARAPPAFA